MLLCMCCYKYTQYKGGTSFAYENDLANIQRQVISLTLIDDYLYNVNKNNVASNKMFSFTEYTSVASLPLFQYRWIISNANDGRPWARHVNCSNCNYYANWLPVCNLTLSGPHVTVISYQLQKSTCRCTKVHLYRLSIIQLFIVFKKKKSDFIFITL